MMSAADDPIFVLAHPRMGGTLVATMIGAHPGVGISYEIYENLLTGCAATISDLARTIRSQLASSHDELIALRAMAPGDLRTFLYRARRGGLTASQCAEEIAQLASDRDRALDPEGRLAVVERLMIATARRRSAARWGGKSNLSPEVLRRRYPAAGIVAVARDGRDVLASMRTKGAFDASPESVAHSLCERLNAFREFALHDQGPHHLVVYERLVRDPQTEVKKLCAALSLPFDANMIDYRSSAPSLLRNPHGHLSAPQLARGLNDESVGRWRMHLTPSEIARFQQIAEPLMTSLGYAMEPAAS